MNEEERGNESDRFFKQQFGISYRTIVSAATGSLITNIYYFFIYLNDYAIHLNFYTGQQEFSLSEEYR